MKNMISEIYMSMRLLGIVNTQEQFSTEWLGKSPRYYSAIKAMKREPGFDGLTRLALRLDDFLTQMPLNDERSKRSRQLFARMRDRVWRRLEERCASSD